MHRRHHTVNRPGLLAFAGAALVLSACAPTTRPDPPGLLGALFDRPPPAITVAASGPYGNPLAEPVPSLISADMADRMIAQSLRPALSAEARLSLAAASVRAATATTGTTVMWQSADTGGAVVPARDPYRSHRGEICRDLQQQAQSPAGPTVDLMTLCHADLGDGRVLWLPGSPD
jgi:surface antigen